jgi:hypothetical protein
MEDTPLRFRTRPHFARNLSLIILAGAVAGFAAAGKVGPFHTLGVTGHTVAATLHQAPLSADQFFPAPTDPATTKHVVLVQDPPKQVIAPASETASAEDADDSTSDVYNSTEDLSESTEDLNDSDDTTPASTTTSTASATPTPCHDDGCGGGGKGD